MYEGIKFTLIITLSLIGCYILFRVVSKAIFISFWESRENYLIKLTKKINKKEKEIDGIISKGTNEGSLDEKGKGIL